MLFVIHFFALSYIGTQIVEILPLDKTSSNYPYDIIWMARQNDEKYSEKIAEKYNGTVKHIPDDPGNNVLFTGRNWNIRVHI